MQLKCYNTNTENSINLNNGFGRDRYTNGVVFENGYYSINFVIYSAKEIVSGEFYIDEEEIGSLELIEKSNDRYDFKVVYKGSNEKDRSYPFLMMIDSVRLRVRLIYDDDTDDFYSSDKVLVTTKTNDDQKNVDDMIYYISGEHGLSRQIDTSYEEDTITLGLYNNLVSNIIKTYNKHKAMYERDFSANEQIISARRRILTSDFLGSNLTRGPKVEKERLEIMEFLNELTGASKKLYKKILDITKDMEKKYTSIKRSLPEGYSAPIVITYKLRIDRVYVELRRLVKNIEIMQNILLRNRFKSKGKFKLTSNMSDYINPVFWAYMNRWVHARKVNLRYHEFYFNIDSLDKLYEYYCLARLLNCIKDMGYIKAETKDKQFYYPTVNNVFQNEDTLFNTFYRERDGVKLSLYFQPLIYRDQSLNGIELLRTSGGDDNFTNFNKTGNYYSPDFILKFQGKTTKYLILDAKYQSRNTILRGHMDQVISKYYNQIRKTDGKRDQMVYVLQGRFDENKNDIWFYENLDDGLIEDFYSDFGIFKYSPDNSRNMAFFRLIERLAEEVK